MNIQFELKDRNGKDLYENDKVNWVCPNLTIEDCSMFGMVNKMWNSGEVISGRLIFRNELDRTLELMFHSDDDDIHWSIRSPLDGKHKSLEKV
jgi:hypothetical protein